MSVLGRRDVKTILLQAIALPLLLLSASYMVAHYVGPDLWIGLAAAAVAGLLGAVLALVNSEDLRNSNLAIASRVACSLLPDRYRPLLKAKPETLK